MAGVRAASGWSKGRVAIAALVPGLLFVDMATGLVGGGNVANNTLSPSDLARGAILVWAVSVVIRVQHPFLRKLQLWVVALFVSGSIGFVLAFLRSQSPTYLMVDVVEFSKVMYGPALVLLLTVLVRRYYLTSADLFECVAWVGAVAGTSILLLTVAGWSVATYARVQIGSKGAFIAQNNVGLAMSLALIAGMHLAMTSRRWRHFAIVLATFVGMLLIGTRAATIGAFAIPFVMLLIQRYRGRLTWRRAFIVTMIVVVAGVGLVAAGVWEYRKIRAEPFQAQRFEELRANPFVRGVLVQGALRYLRKRPVVENVFGSGASVYGKGVAVAFWSSTPRKDAEVDWLDLFGEYGIAFTILIFAYYIGFVGRALRRKDYIGAPVSWTAVFAIVWFLAHSVIAGHAIAATIPAGTLAPILALVWVKGAGGANVPAVPG